MEPKKEKIDYTRSKFSPKVREIKMKKLEKILSRNLTTISHLDEINEFQTVERSELELNTISSISTLRDKLISINESIQGTINSLGNSIYTAEEREIYQNCKHSLNYRTDTAGNDDWFCETCHMDFHHWSCKCWFCEEKITKHPKNKRPTYTFGASPSYED